MLQGEHDEERTLLMFDVWQEEAVLATITAFLTAVAPTILENFWRAL